MTRRFGAFEVDLATGELRKGGTPVRLQEQPAKLLRALLEHPGEVVSREDLVKLLWPDGTFVDYDRGLNAAVNRLRQALSDSAESPRYVETVARKGYRFIASIESPDVPANGASPEPAHVPVSKVRTWIASTLTVLVVAIGAWLLRSKSGSMLNPSAPVPLTSYDGVETEPSFSPDGSQVAFAWNGRTQDNFDIYTKVVGSGAPHRLITNPASDRGPAWSPDGRWIAFVREQQGIFVVAPVGGVERRLLQAVDVNPRLSWSPDSRNIAFTRNRSNTEPGGVFLIPVLGGGPQRLNAPGLPDTARTVAFSPDGRWLAFDSSAIQLDESINPKGPVRVLAQRRGAIVVGLAWTTDSSAVLFSEYVPSLGLGQGAGQQLVRVSVRDNREPQPISLAGQGATLATISRFGSRLAYSKTQSDTDIWRLEDGEFTRSPLSSTHHDGSPQFSPDGSKVVFASNRTGVEEIWVANADGSGALQLTNSIASGTPRWSPDGRWIVYDSRSSEGSWHIRVMDAVSGTSSQLTEAGISPSFSRDGKWIYYAGRDHIFRVPADGGAPSPVAEVPWGRAPLEALNGRSVYFTVVEGCGPLFVRHFDGSQQKIVAESVCYGAIAVTPRGIYYVRGSADGASFEVLLLDPTSGKSTLLGESRGRYLGQGLTVSPDGKTVLLSAGTRTGADLYLVENFR